MKKEFSIKKSASPIFNLIQKKIKDEYMNLSKNKVQPWFALHSGKKLRIEDFYGKTINYEGINFEGTPKMTFWDDYIDPFLEDIIIKNIRQTTRLCREYGIAKKKPFSETEELLKTLVYNIYYSMNKLCKISFKKLETKIKHMNGFIDKTIDSECKLKRPNRKRFH